MRFPISIAAVPLALVAMLGCATTKVTDREDYEGKRLARPDHIFVHDFATTGDDLPEWSDAKDRYPDPSNPRTDEETATGRKLGAEVAKELVARIRAMGLPAVRAAGQPAPQPGDISLVGHFTSIEKGSAVERVVIGFGAGAPELTTQVEGYEMTASGMRRLGSGDVSSAGGKGAGVIVPLAITAITANPIGLAVGGAVKVEGEVTGRTTIEGSAKRTADEIADQLRTAFQKQGWI